VFERNRSLMWVMQYTVDVADAAAVSNV